MPKPGAYDGVPELNPAISEEPGEPGYQSVIGAIGELIEAHRQMLESFYMDGVESGAADERRWLAAQADAEAVVRALHDATRGERVGFGQAPDFVMVGVATQTGVMLLASAELTDAGLERRTTGIDRIPIRPGGPVARVPHVEATVSATMPKFDTIQAENYQVALASLQEQWQRRQASPLALPPGDSVP
jgi:hypothetical protein